MKAYSSSEVAASRRERQRVQRLKIPQALRIEFEREARVPGEMTVRSDASDYSALPNLNQTTNTSNAVAIEQAWLYQMNDDVFEAIMLAHPRWASYRV